MPVKKVTKTKKEIVSKKSSLSVDVFSVDGKVSGEMELPKEIFGVKVNEKLLAQAVRVHLANSRQGTLGTKTRAEVVGSNRKIYAQKGTGRARHGSIKAPIFVGGGIVFGPKPRDFSLKLPQKMKLQALISSLSDKFQQKRLLILNDLKNSKIKTKEAMGFLLKLNLEMKKGKLLFPTLLVCDNKHPELILASRNISNLDLTPPQLLNAYQILTHKNIIFTKDALETGLKQWTKKSS